MRYVEYGKENEHTILLLHGGGLSWWSYDEVARSLQDDYRIILPILDGHAESDAPFTTIEDNAIEIINFIDTHFDGKILMLGGLSLGAQIALEILSRRTDICKFAVIESALVTPSRLTYSLIKPAFGSCYGLIKHKWFSKLQFKSLRIKSDLFDLYYKDTSAISKKDMIAFLEANSMYSLKKSIKDCMAKIHIFVGEKEGKPILKSAKIVNQALQNSELQVLKKLYHGEFSINHGTMYAEKIRAILES